MAELHIPCNSIILHYRLLSHYHARLCLSFNGRVIQEVKNLTASYIVLRVEKRLLCLILGPFGT